MNSGASGRTKTLVVTTTPGFAGLWLIPRLAGFTVSRPDVDVRISAAYALANLNRDGIDVAIRYAAEASVGAAALRLFGEVAFPVCSPLLRRDPARPLRRPEDLRRHVLLHMEADVEDPLLSWSMWLRAMHHEDLKPAAVLHFSQYDQMIQAAVSGQGVALGRSPLVDGLLRQRKLVAPFDKTVASTRSYYVLQSDAAGRKPEVQEFVAWLRDEAGGDGAATAPDPGSSGRRGRAPA